MGDALLWGWHCKEHPVCLRSYTIGSTCSSQDKISFQNLSAHTVLCVHFLCAVRSWEVMFFPSQARTNLVSSYQLQNGATWLEQVYRVKCTVLETVQAQKTLMISSFLDGAMKYTLSYSSVMLGLLKSGSGVHRISKNNWNLEKHF
jgi:hypothetical protein